MLEHPKYKIPTISLAKVFFGFPFKDTSPRWRQKKTGKVTSLLIVF